MKMILHLMSYVLIAVACISCSKDWLNVKADKKLATPSNLADLQALLDNTATLNTGAFGLQSMAELGTDNYFIEPNDLQALPANIAWQRNAYFFERDIFQGVTNVTVWLVPYTRMLYANVVLETLGTLPVKDSVMANNIKGSALFIRAHTLFWIAQIYGNPYKAETASTDEGVPVRLTGDINAPTIRATVVDCYKQMIADIEAALPLLPNIGENKTRPSRAACYGLLSRIYLCMGNYSLSLAATNNCLSIQSSLMDYNTIVTSPTYPVPKFNAEIIYYDINATSVFNPSRCRVDTFFYQSYDANDLRKAVFFKPRSGTRFHSFNGSYDGTFQFYGGVTTDEIYLTRAECYARLKDSENALKDLNHLLLNRWKNTVTFTNVSAASWEDALNKVLVERRKELCFRGLRWIDLRRLNMESGREVTVQRRKDNGIVSLPPRDARYVYPIPDDIISFTGISQNLR